MARENYDNDKNGFIEIIIIGEGEGTEGIYQMIYK